MLGVVIASADRSRLYFRYESRPCFPLAVAPDRALHHAYGLPAEERTPELLADLAPRAARFLRDMNMDDGGDPIKTFHHYDGWNDTAGDDAEFKRPLQGRRVLPDRPARCHSVGEGRPDHHHPARSGIPAPSVVTEMLAPTQGGGQ